MGKDLKQIELEYLAFKERWVRDAEQTLAAILNREINGEPEPAPAWLATAPRMPRVNRHWDPSRCDWIPDEPKTPSLNELRTEHNFKMQVRASQEPTVGSPLDGRTARYWRHPELEQYE